ncbi:hypothetical protein [Nocardia niwae]|uniref:Uncharacterized protein n=1 Tax=Nocardia niwae TaxID=626084 RepID=A0ABV2XFD7_9NOCA
MGNHLEHGVAIGEHPGLVVVHQRNTRVVRDFDQVMGSGPGCGVMVGYRGLVRLPALGQLRLSLPELFLSGLPGFDGHPILRRAPPEQIAHLVAEADAGGPLMLLRHPYGILLPLQLGKGGPLALGRRFDTLPVMFAHQLVLLPLGRIALLYFGSRARTRVCGGILNASGGRIRLILCANVFGLG